MKISIAKKEIEFEKIQINILQKNIFTIYYCKNNKTLEETLNHKKYFRLKENISVKHYVHLKKQLGDFLKALKESGDEDYLKFLNELGDKLFCEFKINERLNDKGIYCFLIDKEIKYIGRCIDNFGKRINQGYGKIYPKNCFIDGQITNCKINSTVNSLKNVTFGIYIMNDKTTDEIKNLEKEILLFNNHQLIFNTKKK